MTEPTGDQIYKSSVHELSSEALRELLKLPQDHSEGSGEWLESMALVVRKLVKAGWMAPLLVTDLRAERDLLGRQQQAVIELANLAEAQHRNIHPGEIHQLVITDPADDDRPRYSDVDIAVCDGVIQLIGNGNQPIANLDGDKAEILRDMLADTLDEREHIRLSSRGSERVTEPSREQLLERIAELERQIRCVQLCGMGFLLKHGKDQIELSPWDVTIVLPADQPQTELELRSRVVDLASTLAETDILVGDRQRLLDDANRRIRKVRDAEKLAELFHATYERLAPDYGYRTRDESAKPWADVPETNRALMVATCREVILAALDGEDEEKPS